MSGKLHLSQVLLAHLDCIRSLPCSLLAKHSRMLFFKSTFSKYYSDSLETVLLRPTFILPYFMGFFLICFLIWTEVLLSKAIVPFLHSLGNATFCGLL